MKTICAALLMFLMFFGAQVFAQTTSFVQQGNLGFSTTANYDLQFKLFDAATNGTQQGTTVDRFNVSVSNGDYKVTIDFGNCTSCFNGADRFLEVSYRPAGGGSYTIVNPRDQITSSPYAIRSANSGTADSLSSACVSCVTSSQIASIPSGSSNYIQNTTTQQSANLNIGGDGTANVFNARMQFNLNGIRMLSGSNENLFVGLSAGSPNNTGFSNTFVGPQSGNYNTSGYQNSFFGTQAGLFNTTGTANAFFGTEAGRMNTTASFNSAFGYEAGTHTVSGSWNVFFGAETGQNNSVGSANSFFGTAAGRMSNGNFNTFIGDLAGDSYASGDQNTLVGYFSDVGGNGLTNATAIGAYAQVNQSNSLILGSINGVNGSFADTKVGIGTTAPSASLSVISKSTNSGNNTAEFQAPAIGPNISHIHWGLTGDWFVRSAASTGSVVLQDLGGNVGIGTSAPAKKLHVVGDSVFSGNVGINTTTPAYKLDVSGRIRLKQNPGDTGNINTAGIWLFQNTPNVERAFVGMTDDINVGFYGNNGAGWGLVMNTQNGRVGIATMSPDQTLSLGFGNASKPGGGSWAIFSDERLKNIKGRFTSGLKAVMQLQPIRYEYKPNNALSIRPEGESIGFSAQAVQKIIPEAVITNDKGYLLINNDPIIWTMLNAIKEQQNQIEKLRVENAALQLKMRAIEKRFRKGRR